MAGVPEDLPPCIRPKLHYHKVRTDTGRKCRHLILILSILYSDG